MRRIIGLLAFTFCPLAQAIEYREELAPPNVDFYLELQGTGTDYGSLGGGEREGLRIRLGLDMKDAKLGDWMMRAEVGLNQFGESRVGESRFDPGSVLPNDQLIIDTSREFRLAGIEAGARLYDNELFFLRGGLFLYSLKARTQETRTEADVNGEPVPGATPNPLPPDQESISGIGPYLGAGFEFPLVDSVKAVAEFNAYRVEKEYVNNLSLGFRFEF